MVTDYFFVYSYFSSVRKKIVKNFWDMEIIGNRRKMVLLKNFILFHYSAELFGASGVSFAINDGTRSVETALRGQGQTVQPGKYLLDTF